MSKLYKKYQELKNIKDERYLFKVGIFYIFIDEDAKEMSKLLNLKCVNLNDNVLKCGFSINALDKYLNILKDNNIEISIVDKVEYEYEYDVIANARLNRVLKKIEKIDINKITGIKAIELINELKGTINGI